VFRQTNLLLLIAVFSQVVSRLMLFIFAIESEIGHFLSSVTNISANNL